MEQENLNNEIIIENIDAYKLKLRRKVIISVCINILVVLLTLVLTMHNNMIFEVLGRLFVREKSIHYNDASYCKIIGLVGFNIIYTLFLFLQLTILFLSNSKKITSKDVLYFSCQDTKDDSYEKYYKEEKKHVYETSTSKIFSILRSINDYYLVILIAILTVIILFTFIMFPAEVNQSSMENTLYDGNKVIIFNKHKANNNDIVVFEYDNNYQKKDDNLNGDLLIKRVIAKEGDTFNCINGKIYVNNELINEEYVSDYNKSGASYSLLDIVKKNSNSSELLEYVTLNNKLPDGYYLLLGDNRIISNDSEDFGLVYYKQLCGVVKYYKNDFGWNKVK